MSIYIEPARSDPEPDICIREDDARLIAQISDRLGKIEAIRVTRWLTKASLKTSKDFVESLNANTGAS
jgi:ribosomal protein L7/L12